MQKQLTVQDAVARITDGMTIMVGGFLGVGTPESILEALAESGVKDLTLIANDTSFPDKNYGKLIVNRQVKKVITSHIGTNPETGRQMNAGEIEVVLTPQGTLAEQIRAKGAGLGAVVTPTGVGTVVEEGKDTLTIDSRKFLVEKPLGAHVALIRASKSDEKGNLVYDKAARNFNPLMAMAADLVIAEVDEVVAAGEIDPDHVVTPHIFVHHIVKGGLDRG